MLIDIGIDARHDEWQLSSNFKVSETTHNQSISTRKCGGVGIRTATRAKVATKRKRKKSKLNRRTDNSSCKTRSQQTCLKRAAVAIVLTRRERKYGETQTARQTDTVGSSGDDRDWRASFRFGHVAPVRSRPDVVSAGRVGGTVDAARFFDFLSGRSLFLGREVRKSEKRERERDTDERVHLVSYIPPQNVLRSQRSLWRG